MPSVAAGVAAMVAGRVLDDVLQPYLGVGLTLVLSFAGSTVIFFVARNWLKALRDG